MSNQIISLFVGLLLGALAFDAFAGWQAKRKAIRYIDENRND